MTEAIDLAFEFDRGTDPDRATEAVLAVLNEVPGATDVDTQLDEPMDVDASQVVVTILAVFSVLKVTVQQLDELTTSLKKTIRNMQGLRRVVVRSGDETREVDGGDDG